MFRYAGVAEWQTHLTQNQAGNTVWVQVPPPAPTLGGKTFVLPPIFIFMNLYTLSKYFSKISSKFKEPPPILVN